KLEDIMKSKDTESTEQFLVEITKPERHGLFYQREKEATLAWLVKKDYISVNVLVYDEEANCYVKYEDPDDPDFGSWDITPDSIKFFTKTFKINKDSLKIRLVAYVKSELKDLKPGKNLQISNFTFNLFKESTKVNGFIKYQNMVDGIK
ncbi:MAG TPA: hypothetical protein GXX14_13990, partial [Clostridiaceae bacterium]|nr:hypothetical protein [Clostridiaceae bacterium]